MEKTELCAEGTNYFRGFRDWPEVTMQELEVNCYELARIPPEKRSYELCLFAAQHSFQILFSTESLLYFVPKEHKTAEMCREVVARDGEALRDVPTELCTRELCMLAVSRFGEALSDVPRCLRDAAMCEAAVREDGAAFYHVPQALKTEALCLLAVSSMGEAYHWLHDAPDACKTERVCALALRRSPKSCSYFPDEMVSKLRHGFVRDTAK